MTQDSKLTNVVDINSYRNILLPNGDYLDINLLKHLNSFLVVKIISMMDISEYSGVQNNLVSYKNHVVTLENINLYPSKYHNELINAISKFGFIIDSSLGEIIIYGFKDNGLLVKWYERIKLILERIDYAKCLFKESF